MIAVKLGCDRSRNVAMVTNLLFIQTTQFFRHSYQCVAFSHDAFDRRIGVGLIHDPLTSFVDHTNTPTTCRGVPR